MQDALKRQLSRKKIWFTLIKYIQTDRWSRPTAFKPKGGIIINYRAEDENMTLSEGVPGKTYRVECTRLNEKAGRRLEALGLIHGTRVEVLNKKKRGACKKISW